jgi:Na+-translocating ferredoxin:NAD+ oxidoreductase subunit B
MDETLKIYQSLADHLDRLPEGFPKTPTGVELRILRRLFTSEQAALAQFVTLKPEPAEAIASRAGSEVEATTRKLEEMSSHGLIFRLRKGEQVLYMAAQFLIGIWEFHVNDLDVDLIRDVNEYLPYFFKQKTQVENPQLRTIPIGKALTPEQPIMPYEEARRIIAEQDKIVVAPCICRKEHQIIGGGCDRPLEACLVFGVGAEYYQENRLGRPIGHEEALKILDEAENAGLVLQPSNSQKVVNICTCCGCCCQVLKNLKSLPEPGRFAASNYFAVVNGDICAGCETCLDRCQMEAIEMDGPTASIIRKRCIGCGLCVPTCPEDAIRLQEKPEAERSTPPPNRMDRFKRLTEMRLARQKEDARQAMSGS